MFDSNSIEKIPQAEADWEKEDSSAEKVPDESLEENAQDLEAVEGKKQKIQAAMEEEKAHMQQALEILDPEHKQAHSLESESLRIDNDRLAELESKEDYEESLKQKWLECCQLLLAEMWKKFGSEKRELTNMEKIHVKVQEMTGAEPLVEEYTPTTEISILPSPEEKALGITESLSIQPQAIQKELLEFYQKGITQAQEIFNQSPKIKQVFDNPQLWQAAKQRVVSETHASKETEK